MSKGRRFRSGFLVGEERPEQRVVGAEGGTRGRAIFIVESLATFSAACIAALLDEAMIHLQRPR